MKVNSCLRKYKREHERKLRLLRFVGVVLKNGHFVKTN